MILHQKEAIERLLSDDDPFTVDLVKEQLVSKGEESLPELQQMLSAATNDNVRRHVTEVLGEIDSRQAADELSLLCPLFPDYGNIEHASWLLARVFLPGISVERYLHILDQYARELAPLLKNAPQPAERIAVIAAYLGKRHGFRGNSDNYYLPDNSLLPRVIDSKRGIPISLTLLYMVVGGRSGISIDGVNLPGHFLARHDGILFDPFEGGRIVTLADCTAILSRQNLAFDPSHLEVATPRVMFRRMLTNLLYIFQNNEDEARAEQLAGWINALDRD